MRNPVIVFGHQYPMKEDVGTWQAVQDMGPAPQKELRVTIELLDSETGEYFERSVLLSGWEGGPDAGFLGDIEAEIDEMEAQHG